MATATIGSLRVVLGMNSASFDKGLGEAQKRLGRFSKDMTNMGRQMQKVGAGLSLAVTGPLAAIGVQSTRTAMEYREAVAQVEAGLTSMGNVSGRTLAELKAQANDLKRSSLFNDQDILKSVTANMLTFGNIAGEQFDRAQQAALDLSTRLDQDLKSSTIQIGKALNDPIRGISALSRVGVQFTDDQKAMIQGMAEAGDVAGAQSLILAELERQYKGSALAAQDAAPGDEVMDAWNDFKVTLGEIIVQILPPITQALAALIDRFNNMSPAMQKAVLIAGAVAAALGPIVGVVGTLLTVLGPLVTVLGAVAGAASAGGLAGVLALLGPFGIAIGVATAAVIAAKAAFDVFVPLLGSASKAHEHLYGVMSQGQTIRENLKGATDENIESLKAETLAYLENAKAALASQKAALAKQEKGARTANAFRGTALGGFSLAASGKLTADAAQSRKAIADMEADIAATQARLASATAGLTKPVNDVVASVADASGAAAGQVDVLRETVSQLQTDLAGAQSKIVEIDIQTPEQIDAQTASYDLLTQQLELLAAAYERLSGVVSTMPPLPAASGAGIGGALNGAASHVCCDTGGIIDGLEPVEIGAMFDEAQTGLERIGVASDDAGNAMVDNFTRGINSFTGLINAFKSGDISGIIQGVAGAIGGVGGGGGGGAGIAGLIGGFAGFFDGGGRIGAGQWGIAGERGPEIVSGSASVMSRLNTSSLLSRASGSAPRLSAGDMGERQVIVRVESSEYFDAHVDGRAAKVAQPISQMNSQAAVGQASQAAARRSSKRL